MDGAKGVYICIAAGVISGLLLKTCGKGLSWEAGTFIQIAVCFAGFFGGALFGTSKRERESKEELFATLLLGGKEHKEGLSANGNCHHCPQITNTNSTRLNNTFSDTKSGKI
jgi:hypothetical protein